MSESKVLIGSRRIDWQSVYAAILGGLAYLALACLSLVISRAGDVVSTIWLPNACTVAFLLRVRLRNEWPFLIAVLCASLAANVTVMLPQHVSMLFSFANVVEIGVVLAITRRAVGWEPDMQRLPDLAHVVWAGGLVGPLVSACLIAPVTGTTLGQVHTATTTWFLTDSMAMVLIVPTALLLIDMLTGRAPAIMVRPVEGATLLFGGMICAFLVFDQARYPLMFLIQPITLLHAFRLGSVGTAMHVGGVAIVAGAMTWAGLGPIAAASGGGFAQLHLLQAFIAANFLTGLPVAAILAGRDRIMAELEAGKRQLDLLADNITDAVLRFDLEGVCTYASPSVREVLGAAPETFVGKPAEARLHPEAHQRAMEAMERLITGISEKERVTYRRLGDAPDGTPVFLEADAALVRNPNTWEPEGIVVATRDVTERVELELLLTRARRHAENAARAKSEFLANMSHEIRTPMNGMLGFAELLLQGDLAQDQRRYADMIVRSGRSMMMLLNDVLDLSKIESGQFAIDPAPVDLHATLAECAALHRISAEKKGLTLEFEHPCRNAPDRANGAAPYPWVLTDGLRLRQIVLNLIGNAVKFTQAGHIRLSYAVTGDEVCISVCDSGIGISPSRLETIFEPFTQGEADTDRRFGGTGLGLSISRQLARLLGGRVEVESTPDIGSCFTLKLPATLVAPEQPSLEPEPLLPVDLPRASRILLAEDHDINRLLMTEMLERCGQDVAVAQDGNEAIAMVIEAIMRGRPFDLILMDVQMPDCDGYTAARAIRAEGIGPDLLPIIALTANAFPEDIAAARSAGMQAHLAKPIALANLARALQRWLPTRIIEATSSAASPNMRDRVSALAMSPRLVARWQERRHEAIEAVRSALGGEVMAGTTEPTTSREQLITLVHKLAGTAALFGEPDLGDCAAALEYALTQGESTTAVEALANELLMLADGLAFARGTIERRAADR